MEWGAISFVMSSKLRFRILVLLKESQKTPTDLKLLVSTQLSNVSGSLKELEEMGLVKCLTPERKKLRFYAITEDGIKILDKINKITERKK